MSRRTPGPSPERVRRIGVSFRDAQLAREAMLAAAEADMPFSRWGEFVIAATLGHTITPTLSAQGPLPLGVDRSLLPPVRLPVGRRVLDSSQTRVKKISISFTDAELADKALKAAAEAEMPFSRWAERVIAEWLGYTVAPALASAQQELPLASDNGGRHGHRQHRRRVVAA